MWSSIPQADQLPEIEGTVGINSLRHDDFLNAPATSACEHILDLANFIQVCLCVRPPVDCYMYVSFSIFPRACY